MKWPVKRPAAAQFDNAQADNAAQVVNAQADDAQVDNAQADDDTDGDTPPYDDTAQVTDSSTKKKRGKKGKEKAVLLATVQRSNGSMPRVHQQLKQRRSGFAAGDVAVVQKCDNGERNNTISNNSLQHVLTSRKIPIST